MLLSKCTDARGGTVVRATAIFVDRAMTSAGIPDQGPISAFAHGVAYNCKVAST
jgi:hypothetical protein